MLFSALLAGATLIGAVYAAQGSSSCPNPKALSPAVAPVPALALAPAADARLLAAASTTGEATHYVLASGGGNCSYPGPPSDNLYVALSPGEYDAGAACGGYLDVTGPGGTVRVKVVDQCPECAAGHIDLSETAFAHLAPLNKGIVSITYRGVQNPPLPGSLSVRVKEGSSAYWLALLIDNHGNPLTTVQVASSGGAFHSLVRASYNYWIYQSGLGSGPFTVAITDAVGHTVKVGGVKLEPGVVQGSGIYMYGSGSTVTVASPAPTPTHTPSPSATTSPQPTATTSATTSATPQSTPNTTGTPSTAAGVTSSSAGCV